MKAISLTEPWATLVVIGAKKYETRSWNCQFRGPLLIHASAAMPKSAVELCYGEPFLSILKAAGIERISDFKFGCIIGGAYLENTFRTREVAAAMTTLEKIFGDFGPKRYAFQLLNPMRFKTPVACGGSLKLWEVQQRNMDQIREECPGLIVQPPLPLFDTQGETSSLSMALS